MRRGLVAGAWLCVVAAACGPGQAPEGSRAEGLDVHRTPESAPPDSPPRPIATPATTLQQRDTLALASSHPAVFPLGFGRIPTPAEIADRDIDVKPDGSGLPPGSGTVEEGARVYAARCASCHGADGLGTPAGWPLVGRNPGDAFDFNESLEKERRRTVGNYWPYAPTLFDYTRRAMPYDAPGSLTADEVYAVTAWILWTNRIIGHEEVMDRRTLPEVLMPAHDRFIPDDRLPPSG